VTVKLDPEPDRVLLALYSSDPHIPARIDECIDWIEADPMDPRVYRRMFSNGVRAITSVVSSEEWLVLWEPTDSGIDYACSIGQSDAL